MKRHVFDDFGTIWQFSGGYAMRFHYPWATKTTCCDGHETPEEARQHGTGVVAQLASERGARDVVLWAEKATHGMACHDDGEGLCCHGTCDACWKTKGEDGAR